MKGNKGVEQNKNSKEDSRINSSQAESTKDSDNQKDSISIDEIHYVGIKDKNKHYDSTNLSIGDSTNMMDSCESLEDKIKAIKDLKHESNIVMSITSEDLQNYSTVYDTPKNNVDIQSSLTQSKKEDNIEHLLIDYKSDVATSFEGKIKGLSSSAVLSKKSVSESQSDLSKKNKI